jgi:hypothetical protein
MDTNENAALAPSRGDPRGGDRRNTDRRRDDRRAPPPAWRRPSAFVAYGVVGTILLVLLLRGVGAGEPEREIVVLDTAGPSPATQERRTSLPDPPAPTRDAFGVASYERLLAEGDAAVGEIVRAELFCGSISSISVREPERAHPTIASLADADGRVGGAECRWSREARSSDFLLIVPPDLAERFARAPEVELNFVRRRRIPAHVEWLGKSESLSLRNSGVLREIAP